MYSPIQNYFQSDTLISNTCINIRFHLVLDNESDFGFLRGVKVLKLSDFKLFGQTKESHAITNITLSTPPQRVLVLLENQFVSG